MERLPYIDEYAIPVDADAATTWAAVLRVLCRDPLDPTTVPTGFVLDEATPYEQFALKGRHWFAAYRLVFQLSPLTDAPTPRTRLAAQTWAAFPGFKGRIYRALVIGSGGHGVVVRRMLQRIGAVAENGQEMATP